MGLLPTKVDQDDEWINSWQAETPAPPGRKPLRLNVGQALSPANFCVFKGVTMGLRPTKVDEDAKWGRTPWSARVPLDPLFGRRRFLTRPTRASPADQGVRPT